MKPCVLTICGCFVAMSGPLALLESASAQTLDVAPFFSSHCLRCHGEERRDHAEPKIEGDVNLTELSDSASIAQNPDLVTRVIEALEFRSMPPETEQQPTDEARSLVLASLQRALLDNLGNGGGARRTPLRRMNRFQYSNAVVDLLELRHDLFALPERIARDHGYFDPDSEKMPAKVKVGNRPLGKSQMISRRLRGVVPFPQDLRAEHGFDNRGDHLTMSPLLMESFLRLSTSIFQSPDFGKRNCGIWATFFQPPPNNENIKQVYSDRLRTFLSRAFRRPVADQVLDRYVRHVSTLYESGTPFEDCMKSAASAALASPRFLYLYDRSTTGNRPERTDAFELAARLSFFLWGSLPDAKLRELAATGELTQPAVLSAQVDRMLRDKKIKRFCDSFPAQWLQLERLLSSLPDREQYPGFFSPLGEYRASMHMMLEPLLLFETILIEDRPILELIDSPYSYRSDYLDRWYRNRGTNNKRGFDKNVLRFNRVSVKDRREGGVFTTAAVLTMTSSAVRTKPITRGAWMAGVIFNAPPEPPPADVPPLEENAKGELLHDSLSIREQLSAHMTSPQCAACHARIDPLGFALENYGPVGEWRDKYEGGQEVDASGKLFNQHDFQSIEEFKDAVLQEKPLFLRGFAKHLLSYALAREISLADQPSLDQIVSQTIKHEYRMKSLIKQIVLSDAFQQKFNPTKDIAAQQ